MKVTIKQWNAVAAWRWDMPEDDMCGICRNPYDSTCSKCKYPGDDCPLLKGECHHSFHMVLAHLKVSLSIRLTTEKHCIFSWLRQEAAQEKCPMCRQRKPWPATCATGPLLIETSSAFKPKDANKEGQDAPPEDTALEPEQNDAMTA
jgi:anaphase-promoting complex subunit 11